MLFAVMIIIGGVTYTLVLNLEHVAQSTNDCYNVLKKQVLKPMKKDTAKAWKDRAKKYEVFKPLSTNTKPSEWWVLLYSILWSFNGLFRKILLVIFLVILWAYNSLRGLRHKPKDSDNTKRAVKVASDTEDDDWIKTFPKYQNEAEIPISQPPNPINEKISTPTEKAPNLTESPSAGGREAVALE